MFNLVFNLFCPQMYPPSGVLGPTTRPTLVVPSDPVRWQEMQKNLVHGGVYHVQTGTGGVYHSRDET